MSCFPCQNDVIKNVNLDVRNDGLFKKKRFYYFVFVHANHKKCFFYAIVCFYRFYSPWINLRVFSQKWVPPFRAPKIDDVTIFRHYYYYILLVYISSFPSIYNSNVYLVGPLNSKTRALFWISPLYYYKYSFYTTKINKNGATAGRPLWSTCWKKLLYSERMNMSRRWWI